MENLSEDTFLSLPSKIEDMLEAKSLENEPTKTEKKIEKQISVSESLKWSFYSIHCSIDSKTTSPSKLISLVHTYHDIVKKEKKKIQEWRQKLSAGVSKLNDVREVVAKLKEEAALQEKELAVKQSSANDALQLITDTMRNANTQKDEMQDLKSNTMKEEKLIAERKKLF